MLDNAGPEEIDIAPIEFGPRSRLVKPALFGIGSKNVESLISYIVRIGAAHHVSPMRMLKTIYAPENAVIGGCMYPSFFNYYASTVNGLSKYAQVFVTATENLTGASHLKFNTLLPLMQLLPSTGCGLLTDHPQWCPECIQEMLVSHGQSYRPLIWSLKLYRACTKHHKPLLETCPHCDLVQPHIMHYPDLSRCAYCYQGLNVRVDDDPVEYSEFDYWVFSAIEDLICHLNECDSVATLDALTKFLRQAISHYANGNGTSFCKQIGLSSWAIKGWLNKREKPSLPQLLSVCYGLDMFLSDVFLNACQAHEFSSHVLRKLPEKMLDRAERPLLVAAQRIELLDTLTKFAEDKNEHRPLVNWTP